MPFMPLPVQDAREDEAVPDGEYEIECTACNLKQARESRKPMYELSFVVNDPPEDIDLPAPVFHYALIPVDDTIAQEYGVEADEDEAYKRKLRDMTRLLVALGIPFEANGFNDEDFLGAKATVRLKKEERNDAPGQFSNRLMLPKFTTEQLSGSAGGSKGRGRRARA